MLQALEQDGKLIPGLSIDDVGKLPRSTKGYELYSWLEDDQWNFTLITSTNRNKVLEGITSGDDFISEAGWINILLRVSRRSKLFWPSCLRTSLSSGRMGYVSKRDSEFRYTVPPKRLSNAVKGFAAQCGLELSVAICLVLPNRFYNTCWLDNSTVRIGEIYFIIYLCRCEML